MLLRLLLRTLHANPKIVDPSVPACKATNFMRHLLLHNLVYLRPSKTEGDLIGTRSKKVLHACLYLIQQGMYYNWKATCLEVTQY